MSMSMLYPRATNGTAIDPNDDSHDLLGYIPSNALTTVGVIAFLAVSCGMTFRMFRSRWRALYMLPVLIGAFFMTFGLAMRYPLKDNPDNKTIYLIEYLSVVLSPCAFIAGNYALLGRLARHTGTGRYLIVRATLLSKVFISSDVITFLIQALGGALSISKNASSTNLGSDLFKIGMILQAVSFLFFCLVYIIWIYRVRKSSLDTWALSKSETELKWFEDWRSLAGALAVSCGGILIRSVYRTVEGLQGFKGALATNETTFYALDTLPLFIAVSVYVLIWPGNCIDPQWVALDGAGEHEMLGSTSTETLNRPYNA